MNPNEAIGLHLSFRAARRLEDIGVVTLDNLLDKKPSDLLGIKGFGMCCLREVENVIKQGGYSVVQWREGHLAAVPHDSPASAAAPDWTPPPPPRLPTDERIADALEKIASHLEAIGRHSGAIR